VKLLRTTGCIHDGVTFARSCNNVGLHHFSSHRQSAGEHRRIGAIALEPDGCPAGLCLDVAYNAAFDDWAAQTTQQNIRPR